jgi:hypothetical protein
MDTASNHFSRVQNAAVGHCTAKRRTQGNNRSDIRWSLRGYRASDNPTQTVTDQMDFAPRFGQSLLDGRVQLLFDQEIRALGVETYAGKEWFVSNSPEPLMQGCQINIGAKESR